MRTTMVLVAAMALSACSNALTFPPCDIGDTFGSEPSANPELAHRQGDCAPGFVCIEHGYCTPRCFEVLWNPEADEGRGAWESQPEIEGACDGVQPPVAGSAMTVCREGCMVRGCTYDSECPGGLVCVGGECVLE